ncbi:hypothetical protein BgiMline_013716 [Biomphalaria glabrata]|nr:hypothetical protein BgiMline_012531 [Biomphalaria glabrata]
MDKLAMNAYRTVLKFFSTLQLSHRFRLKTKKKQVELTIIIARKARHNEELRYVNVKAVFCNNSRYLNICFVSPCVCRLRILVSSNSISGISFFCQQSLLPQDDTSDVFLRMVSLVFGYAINVTADVLLSGHYVKLDRLQHHGNWFNNR